jgi:DDE superfamily endonuclease
VEDRDIPRRLAMMSRFFRRIGVTFKKRPLSHLPCGIVSTSLWPLGAQPSTRVILVLVQVSSMKTSRPGVAEAGRRRDPRQSRLPQGRVGGRLVFLPKYSPDLNPIEQVFAKLKTLLRKAEARAYEAIFDTCGEILAHYPPAESAAYIKTEGYA